MLRPLLRALPATGPFTRACGYARTAADHTADVCRPLYVLARGLGRLAAAARQWWAQTPKDRRGPGLFLGGACLLVLYLAPYGALAGTVALLGAAAWLGRDRPEPGPEEPEGPDEEQAARLQTLYEALVPYFHPAEEGHPEPLFTHDGTWEKSFTEPAFGPDGRLADLTLRYPPYFPDGEPASRLRVQQVLCAKAGRGREYRFDWDEEGNQLRIKALDPLPTDICAQRFVVTQGEAVLGFTDPDSVQRTLPVGEGEDRRDMPPVVWRTGPRSSESHLLALGQPGSGTTTLLRSLAVQALQHGDVLVLDGTGTGEYSCLLGRPGVLGVETTLVGALASLEWAAHETQRRLLAAGRARHDGQVTPENVCRPLWLIVDRPAVLSHVARCEGRTDPQDLLEGALRHGRAARVTVALADQFEGADGLSQPVRAYTRARAVLGPATPEQVRAVLGEPPPTTPAFDVPPGRGYARLGNGPVMRLQVPDTPDPLDDCAPEAHRRAVLALLPQRPQSTGFPPPPAAAPPQPAADPA
ncbi:hypothetical protein QNO07_07695 [Streptomyces sp. 549]|uniref:hypothetical protein n=1 Tax=Streptomyces sp. 549 TaxID=3049076 RepID=UPI0024C3E7C6|nr:hypothetical protein [Streptomyces sp. 549]MDK1473303.1 hypothetical protein [Streptomyces sp. 549]